MDLSRTFRAETLSAASMSIVALHGEVDIAAQPALTMEIDRVMAARPVVLAIDLRGLSFMDSSGVHALIATGVRCQQRGMRFFVIRGAPHIDRLLSACGAEGCFEIVGGPDQLTDDDNVV